MALFVKRNQRWHKLVLPVIAAVCFITFTGGAITPISAMPRAVITAPLENNDIVRVAKRKLSDREIKSAIRKMKSETRRLQSDARKLDDHGRKIKAELRKLQR